MNKIVSLFIFLTMDSVVLAQKLPWSDEHIINSTIKIESIEQRAEKGKKKYYQSSGTGFFFGYSLENDREFPVIVTNKHVIKNAYRGVLYFKFRDNSGYPIFGKTEKIILDNFEALWIKHPDTNVDLAILPLMPIINEYFAKYKKQLYYAALPEEIIPTDSVMKTLNAIEDIVMVGYPYGLRDSLNDLPIVRKGLTATPIYLDYTGKKEFLVDMPVFFGSSGSPILVYNNSTWLPRLAKVPRAGTRIILAGVNYATYTRNFEGKVLPLVSNNVEDSLHVQTAIPLYNIGVVIKAERLLDFKPLLNIRK